MKKQLVVLGILIYTFSNAQIVDQTLARKISINSFKEKYHNGYSIKDRHKDRNTDNLAIKNMFTRSSNGHIGYFVVNFENGGWMIVSSHKSIEPILAHSPEGSIDENKKMPELFDKILDSYTDEIDKAYKELSGDKNASNEWKRIEGLDTSKLTSSSNMLKSLDDEAPFMLLSTKWGQSQPNDIIDYSYAGYNILMQNNECTLTNGLAKTEGKVLAGCSPVAIGQILKYWGFAEGDRADFDWWDMPDELHYYSTSPDLNPDFAKQANAISYMLKRLGDPDCLSSYYNCDITTTQNASLYNGILFFKYGSHLTLHSTGALEYDYDLMMQQMRIQIENHQPMLFAGGGHSFVCDGYDYYNKFHFNMGDCGNGDGYYKVDPYIFNTFSSYMWYFTGIYPNWYTNKLLENITIGTSPLSSNETWQASNIEAAGNNTSFTIPNATSGRFVAAQSITLKSGFYAQEGSSFLAKIYQNSTGGLKSLEGNNVDEATTNVTKIDGNNLLTSSMKVTVQPNPSNGKFTVSGSEPIDKLTIVSPSGIIIYQAQNAGYTHEVNLEKVAKGIYIVTVVSGSNSRVEKIAMMK